ncbi:hypothetical protein HMPREF3195_01665 [Peptostreptococcus anaerobius]|uniref:Uncharacterized protein n=1 Tax=Peptostreptococcus anaerobius TaxID=1261 RepID=A0A135YNH0_9FIRM|nr:hypothetical protein HMPREF3195_01665 [Peptostreptococcus anaerobius]
MVLENNLKRLSRYLKNGLTIEVRPFCFVLNHCNDKHNSILIGQYDV